MSASTHAAFDINWQGGATNNNWLTTSNWDSNSLPSGFFDENANIANGGTAIINSDLSAATLPGGVIVTNKSKLDIVASGAFAVDNSGPTVTGGATFTNGGTLALTGGSTSFSARGLSFAGGGVYAPVLTGASHGLISVFGDATLNGGTLKPTISFSPSGPQSWVIADATNIVGSFTLDTSAANLSPGRKLFTSVVNGGINGQQLQLDLKNVLTLTVNADTGATSISSPTGTAITMTGYGVSSAAGQLKPASWTTITSQLGGGWGVGGPPSANHLDELGGPIPPANTTQASLTLNATPRAIGSPFNSDLPFGVTPDLKFEYVNSNDELVEGEVRYTGLNAFNNLLLTVDPSTGQARLTNSSKTTIRLRGYSILSDSGSLKPANGNWNSLKDQGVIGVDEANATANHLSELAPQVANSVTMTSGQSFLMGSLFNTTGTRDLALEFFYTSPLGGDFNNNGTVDATDYAVWRKGLGTTFTQADYTTWKSNFGKTSSAVVPTIATGVVQYQALAGTSAVAAVPEPASLAIAIGYLAAIGSCRPMRRRRTQVASERIA